MSNYLTTDGLRKFSLLPEAPLRPEARGICHIYHMVNPALTGQLQKYRNLQELQDSWDHCNGNALCKYADDIYLIIPAVNVDSRSAELHDYADTKENIPARTSPG